MKSSTIADATIMLPHEAANMLRVEQRQLHRLGVPCIRLGHKTIRYLKSDVLRWLDQQRSPRLKLRKAS